MTQLADNALTTVSRLSSVLGTGPDEDNALIHLINAVSDRLERELGKELTKKQVTEKVAGHGTPTLRVSRRPIISVASIVYNGDHSFGVSSYEIEDAEAGKIRSTDGAWKDTGRPAGGLSGGKVAGSQQRLFEVTYTGGYVTPEQAVDSSDERTLPHDIEQAVVEYAVQLYHEQGVSQAVKSERIDGASITYRDLDDRAPAIWREVLGVETNVGAMIG